MKIQKIIFKTFGPFQNQTLDFGSQANGLHFIYGPNEAGKSTALRGIRSLLFGLKTKNPKSQQDDLKAASFRHAPAQVRIGGVLEDRDGKSLSFMRRHGKPQLRDIHDDKPVDEQKLNSLLTGLDSDSFNRLFGLSHESLRAGAETLLQDNGELGQVLASAGGMKSLKEAHSAFIAQADAILRVSTGRSGELKKKADELKDLRSKIDAIRLKSSDWDTLSETLSGLAIKRQELESQISDKSFEARKLNNLLSAKTSFGRRIRAIEQLTSLSEVRVLRSDFSNDYRKTSEELLRAEQSRDSANKQLVNYQDQLSKITVSENLQEFEPEIEQLSYLLNQLNHTAADSTKLSHDFDTVENQLHNLNQQIGLTADAAELSESPLSEDKKSRIRALIRLGDTVQRQADESQKSLRLAQRELQENQKELENRPALLELRLLEEALDQFASLEELENQLENLEKNRAKDASQFMEQLSRLSGWQGDETQLLTMKLPLLETITEYGDRVAEHELQATQLENQIQKLLSSRQQTDQQIVSLNAEQQVPSQEKLLSIRSQRDQILDDLLTKLKSGELSSKDWTEQLDKLATSITSSDLYVDLLRSDANRVAQLNQLQTQLRDLQSQIETLQNNQKINQQQSEELQSDWRELWKDIPVTVLSPREMRSWHTIAQQVLTSLTARNQQSEFIRTQSDKLQTGKTSLLNAFSKAVKIGDSDELISGSASNIIQIARHHLKGLQSENDQTQKLTAEVKSAQTLISNLQTQADLDQSKFKTWQNDWQLEMESLKLAPNALREQAETALELFQQRETAFQKRNELRQRKTQQEHLEQEIQRQYERLITNLGLPADQSVTRDEVIKKLRRDVKQNQESATHRQQMLKQIEEQELLFKESEQQLLLVQNRVHVLLNEAGSQEFNELPERMIQSEARVKLEEELKQADLELLEYSPNSNLQEYLKTLAATDSTRIPDELDQLEQQIQAINDQLKVVIADQATNAAKFKEMDGNDQAIRLATEAEFLVSQMQAQAQELLILSISHHLLAATLEDYQKTSQGPVLQRGSELFKRLTSNSFSGLKSDFDEKGNPHLIGIRAADDSHVEMIGMSEGTRDQLYLALRIATVEYWISQNQPIPLILDDILLTFDDARASAAIEVLAELSESTQVIFLTHHQHLIELARKQLGESRFRFQELNSVQSNLQN